MLPPRRGLRRAGLLGRLLRWHHREDVGANAEHEELCGRCIDNIEGAGEQRQFV